MPRLCVRIFGLAVLLMAIKAFMVASQPMPWEKSPAIMDQTMTREADVSPLYNQ